MTTIDSIQTGFEELASRESNGISVSLVWRRRDDALKVVVFDARYEETFEIEVGDEPPLDVFHHPFAYASFRDIATLSATRPVEAARLSGLRREIGLRVVAFLQVAAKPARCPGKDVRIEQRGRRPPADPGDAPPRMVVATTSGCCSPSTVALIGADRASCLPQIVESVDRA